MPESYITAALAQLEAKRLEYLNSNKVPRVVYEAAVDPLELKRKNKELKSGDILPFKDAKIGLDDNLQITKVSYTATYPNLHIGSRFEIEIGQEVTYNRIQKIEEDIKQTKEIVTQYSKQSYAYDRRNIRAINEFKEKVFDPDEKLQTALVQGIAALFGSESMYFDLEDIDIAVNAGSDANRLTLTAGKLIHKSYEITGLGYIWNLSAFDQDDLAPLKSYYLAAKVSTTALTGEWVLSENQMATESEVGYYHFNLGVLSSVIEGQRSFNPTRMFTLISGGNVVTDVVTARLINVQKLFAQEIIAENLHVTGDSRVAGFSIDGNKITSADSIPERTFVTTSPAGVFVHAGSYYEVLELLRNGVAFKAVYNGYDEIFNYHAMIEMLFGGNGAMISMTRSASSTNPMSIKQHPFKGLYLRLGTAIDFTGDIIANGQYGYTGKVGFKNESNVTKYMNYYSGIMVGVTDS
ncbi:hypothetical protein [Sphingobacterium bovistauri]|uniref:Uncharacterized protein n=1 Tax=Sphingobacterium bovistauri TaxID=2781959 RepID=A0ABS7ZAZ9_9SPHI|nr:hypothetical protein [Sphingobacterium bovistauri]MCA5006777.1 hypothetical protein [Sphingobacterium bovistauri]